jgi:pSer/pThr/pTyr-binding forkhead associated (FHA) protein
MPPTLVALTEGPNIPLDKPILLLGRHQECDVLIPSRKISRRHCCIAQVHDFIVVKDLFSTNGVRVNGVRVKEGCLRTGDELTVGNYRYKIEMGTSASGSPLAQMPVVAPPQQPPQLVLADHLESCDMPMPLQENPEDGPAPHALPLVLPVNASMKPRPPADPFAENIKLAAAGSGEFHAK